MMMRVIRLLNNFYRDDASGDESDNAFGSLCAIGYYDAVDIEAAVEMKDVDKRVIWNQLTELSIHKLSGEFNQRCLVCITNKMETDENNQTIALQKKEAQFWQDTRKPFLFISMIQLNKKEQENRTLKGAVLQLCKDENSFAYFTNDYNEVVVVHHDNSYEKGVQFVKLVRAKFCVLKMHTIFAIPEVILDRIDDTHICINEEHINCCLYAVVRDMDKVDVFMDELKDRLANNGYRTDQICIYDLLGDDDLRIEIPNITLRQLLGNYANGGLLTHAKYRYVFYNIETELTVARGNC